MVLPFGFFCDFISPYTIGGGREESEIFLSLGLR
jgi:hypothetical protein